MPTPDKPEKPAAEHVLFKTMPEGRRTWVVAVLLLVGLLLQLVVRWYVGVPFIFFGVLMTLYKGVTNEPKRQRFGKWENVTLEEFTKLQEMFEKTANWRSDAFAFSSPLGCLVFVLLAVLVTLGGLGVLIMAGDSNSFCAVVADGAFMLLLLFGSGGRNAWEPSGLKLKLEPLLTVCEYLKRRTDWVIEITPMLELQGKGEKRVPRDCKIMLKPKGIPEGFYGIQVQTSANSVQGTQYPYMYCVLLAKKGTGLVDRAKPLLTPGREEFGWFSNANDKKNPDRNKLRYRDAVVEAKVQKGVELVVVRQKTFGTGYHTDTDGQVEVLKTALDLMAKVCSSY